LRERLKLVLPITVLLIFFLLYMNTKSLARTAIVILAVPFSLVGAVWLLYLLGYNMSIAVWVGMIALMGLDAETGVFMLLFLDLAYAEAKAAGRLASAADLREAIVHGAVKRIRPKMMTVAAAFVGLMPIMWSVGTGADLMKRVAAPMVGGLLTSFLLELLVYPPLYLLWRWHTEVKHAAAVPVGVGSEAEGLCRGTARPRHAFLVTVAVSGKPADRDGAVMEDEMSDSSKHLAFRAFLGLALGAIAFAASLRAPAAIDAAVPRAMNVTKSDAAPARTPFCLPGEKLVCTLGPPPHCSCQ